MCYNYFKLGIHSASRSHSCLSNKCTHYCYWVYNILSHEGHLNVSEPFQSVRQIWVPLSCSFAVSLLNQSLLLWGHVIWLWKYKDWRRTGVSLITVDTGKLHDDITGYFFIRNWWTTPTPAVKVIEVYPLGSASTKYIISHSVGLFQVYCWKWVLAFDFTILSWTDNWWGGWYNSTRNPK